MQDSELFLELAGIAGVFVGFGALIAVRSGGANEPLEVAPVRGVVLAGMATIVAALAPVTLGRYGLTEHQVLALSSVLVLVSYAVLLSIHRRTPEYRVVATTRSRRPRLLEVSESVAYLLVVGGPLLALVVIALGLLSEIEAALYLTVVALFLVQAAWTLLWLVFMERRPANA